MDDNGQLRNRKRTIEEPRSNNISYQEYATRMFLEQCSKNTGPQDVHCALCPANDHCRQEYEFLPPSEKRFLTSRLQLESHCQNCHKYIEQTCLTKEQISKWQTLFVFNQLVESHVDPDWLLDNLRFISKPDMEITIVERARRRTCGYVLCSERLTTFNPQLAYNEKGRQKLFCSLFCYKAANFLLKQMFMTISWRDNGDKPIFKILSRITKFTETCDFKNRASQCDLP